MKLIGITLPNSLAQSQKHFKNLMYSQGQLVDLVHAQEENRHEIEGDQIKHEEGSENVLGIKGPKRQKVELQGEFKKIKPPLFDGEMEEVVKA